MERAGNLLIEENVAHRLENMGVEAQGELPNVARTRVAIENLVQALRVVARGLDDLALLEELCQMVKDTSLCGLGQSAPNPVLSTLRFFRNEYTELLHAPEGYVPSGTANEKSIAQ